MARPVQVYDFTAFSRRTPTAQVPGDRIDAQFREHADAISALQGAVEALNRADVVVRAAPREATLPTPSLYVGAGGPYAGDDSGATATSADYAQVSIEWAEHMPDTIPGNTLAINAISGDHWSSRWWANRAAVLLQSVYASGSAPTAVPIAEPVAVTGVNGLALLSYAPVDARSTMEVVVNGRVFCGCATPPPFTVSGKQITWTSDLYSISSDDEVVARYRFNAGATTAPTAVAGFPAVSLYYLATSGQTTFLLSTPDRFALSYNLRTTSRVEVSRNGLRLMPDDGTGKGGYTVSTNSVSLLWPAGADETIAIDVWEQASSAQMTPQLIVTDVLTIASTNVVPALSQTPDGQSITLFFQGEAFFSPADFSVAGKTITWLNTIYVLPVGAKVEVTYSYANVSPPPPPPAGWWLSLPTTLPPTSGVLWNNGGVICVS